MMMQFKRWFTVLIIIAIAAVVIGFVTFWHPGAAPSDNGGVNASTTASGTVTSTISSGVPAANTESGGNGGSGSGAGNTPAKGTPAGSNVPIVAPTPITINLITPISGNTWTIGGQNPIAWSAPAGITGEIDLVNATTKKFIGVILSETGPNQTSYSWDARSIYLARYSADMKDVVPGTYSIRIRFDGNGLGDLVSGPITISN